MRKLPTYRGWFGRPHWHVRAHPASCARLVDGIRQQARRVRSLNSKQLSDQTACLRERVIAAEPVTSEAIAVTSFALTTEAVRRATGITYFDVQLMGGLVLAVGAVAEIQTGEGKTIVTALPAVLHALCGKGVHVATTNDYLSRRDFEEMKAAYELLGLTTGLIQPQGTPEEKTEAYSCDITYGPGYEFGFDFLRDQLTLRSRFVEPLGARHLQRMRGQQFATDRLAQRGHAFAIIDEADSVLIDEATTPLILSGCDATARTDAALYCFARNVAGRLEKERDFEIDKASQAVALTAVGWATIHQAFHSRPAGHLARPWSLVVEHTLRAEHLLYRDVDYVVNDGQVKIVDQHTGRIHDERKWRAGLHQAVEVKEGLEPTEEKQTQARVTRQRFCQFYERMCGLTGTARGGESEFREFYSLPVVVVPTNRPCIRDVLPSRFFATKASKYEHLAADAADRLRRGQPILIGTRTIRESRAVSQALDGIGVPHTVLNGLQDTGEAAIVSRAGVSATVTVATNMAGRGTDIRLDGTARRAGGLHVAAAGFHESRRVDRQLAGRAARQGDPGSCQFWASADDDLFVNHAPALCARLQRITQRGGETRDDFNEAVRDLQLRLEQNGLESRRRMVAHDKWLESVQSTLARRA